MGFQDKIQPVAQTSQQDGIKILVYGPSGAGKTTLCTTTGNPEEMLVLSAESGLLSIRDSGVQCATIKSVQDLREAQAFLAKGKHGFKWVCLDSISEIGEVLLAEEKEKNMRDIRKAYGNLGETGIALIKGAQRLTASRQQSVNSFTEKVCSNAWSSGAQRLTASRQQSEAF